jgi:hypothetical protein
LRRSWRSRTLLAAGRRQFFRLDASGTGRGHGLLLRRRLLPLRLGLLILRLLPAHASRRPWRRVAGELRERRGRAEE